MVNARRLIAAGMLVPALVLGTAACGGGGGGPTAVASLGGEAGDTATNGSDPGAREELTEEERQEKVLEYTRCMREHGVDMPDPEFGENGLFAMGMNATGDPGVIEKAQEACEHIMEELAAAAPPPELDPEEVEKRREEALEFAKCMREHGIDMPDPEFGEDGMITQRMTASVPDEAFEKAQEECRDHLPGAGPVGAIEGGR